MENGYSKKSFPLNLTPFFLILYAMSISLLAPTAQRIQGSNSKPVQPSGPHPLIRANFPFKAYIQPPANPDIKRSGLIPHVTSGLRIHYKDHPPRNHFTSAPARARFVVKFPILGKGGFGTVYPVKDTSLNQDGFALKVFHPQEFDAGKVELSNQELWKGIPHVLPMETSFCLEPERVVGIIMKKRPRTLLERLTQAGPLSLTETVSLLRKFLKTYEASSAKGIVHGDHKPNNCFVEPEFAICDFGLSHRVKSPRLAPFGAPRYRSPELDLNNPTYDCSIDLWNIGCIGYESFTGKELFKEPDGSNAARLQNIISRNGDFPKSFLKKGFIDNPKLKSHSECPAHWSNDIYAQCSSKKIPPFATYYFVELLSGMLRYENRISAKEGLYLCDLILYYLSDNPKISCNDDPPSSTLVPIDWGNSSVG
ncbi:MAG TPA: protein kinase family protein [Chlamydiales bacterium]|nr:protein kinase family protein [Chlamydiales bacterium]